MKPVRESACFRLTSLSLSPLCATTSTSCWPTHTPSHLWPSGPTPPNLRMFLAGPDGASHILTMRSTFSIEGDRLPRDSTHAFHHHAAGMVRALGLQLREIEVMSAYTMEIGD